MEEKSINKKSTNKMLWQSDLENGRYRNPILHSDYSDPDVIRVGDTYYMTASSFNYMPGLPILTSKDLINWKLVNYAVKNLPYEVYDKPAHAKGIWAPSIRYHHNKFWIYFGMPDEGIFMTSTKDPLKEWEPLVCVKEGRGLIDSCPFWDEDGRAYLIHAYANSRIGIKSKLAVFEMNPEGTACLSEDRVIFDGTQTQPTIEGPKVYKRNGLYYIFAPAGGVKQGWQTVLRSKSIYGPYEEKIVMHQGDTDINGPHQGGLVDTPTGEEWFLHFQQKGAYGRIAHLQPVTWENGWPLIGIDRNGDGIGEPVYEYTKPQGGIGTDLAEPEASDFFDGEKLNLGWQWLANYKESFYSLKEERGRLCLYPMNTTGEKTALLWNSANILSQKIACPAFTAVTKMDFSGLSFGSRSGILIIGAQYAAMYAERQEKGCKIGYLESEGEEYIRKEIIIDEHILEENIIEESQKDNFKKDNSPKDNSEKENSKKEELIKEASKEERECLYLKVHFYQDETCEFYYSTDNKTWSEPTRKFKPQGAVWVGAKVGLFAVSEEEIVPDSKVFFDYFTVIPG